MMSSKYPRIVPPSAAQVAALKHECPFAADQIVRSCEPRLTALAANHERPGCGRDELEQAGRIAAWRAAKRFDPERNRPFEHLATKAIKNAIVSELRANPTVEQELVDVERSTDGSIHRGSLDLEGAMARLEPQATAVIRLLYGEGLSQRQVARALSLSQSRVSQVHRAAIQRLRESIEDAA